MRILLINHFPLAGSGSGVYTANIANSLVNLGHEVCCIYPVNEIDTAEYRFSTHPVYFCNGDGVAPVEGALPFNFPCFTTHPKSVMSFEALTDEQLAMYEETFRREIGAVVEEFKPDIIHSGHIWILADIGGEFGLPLVITAHGTDLIGYRQSKRFHDYAESAARKAKAIISISQANYDEIADAMPFALDKAYIIPNGYNDAVFYRQSIDREEVLGWYGIEKKFKNIVSFAGKFTQVKGIDVLLKACAKYEDDDTATLIAGDGELFDEMTALAEELGLKNAYFLHNQPHDKLRGIYSIADVSLAPSRLEAFGLVVIEAGACGAPVIGTNNGGIADIITDENGVLIDVDDADALAANVRKILDGELVFDHDAVAAYTKKNYSQDQYTEQMVEKVYK